MLSNYPSLVKNAVLRGRPSIPVPFQISPQHLTHAADAFFKFLELPEEIKKHINLKVSPNHRRGEIGYWKRNPEEGIYNDSKEFFHFHPLILERYPEFVIENPIVEKFMRLAQPIWQETYKIIHSILHEFESDYPETLSRVFDSKEPHLILRFLKYNFTDAGEYLAKPHFDSGSFTLAIAESCPGLRIGTCPEDLQIENHEDNKAIFMVSSNCHKIIPNKNLAPAWHDVIQTDETQIGKSFARWAIVAFIDGHSVESLERSETHKFYDPKAANQS